MLKNTIPLQRRAQQSQLGLAATHPSFHHFASIDHYRGSTDLSHTLFQLSLITLRCIEETSFHLSLD